MEIRLVGPILDREVIASGQSIRELRRLRRNYGGERWRKLKGVARVELPNGRCWLAEVHWYECHGFGRRELKIKRFLE